MRHPVDIWGMEYAEFAPAPSLRRLIRCYWQLQSAAGIAASAEPALPDGSPELIINLAGPFEHIGADGLATRQPLVFLVGQITRPMVVRPTGRVDVVAVRFEAHAAAVLHRDLSQLTDGWVDALSLREGALRGLAHQLAAAPSVEQRIAILDESLTRLVQSGPVPDTRVAAAVERIRRSQGSASPDDIAGDLGHSPRTLQRRFARQVGISPKLLARIVRFQRVFATWRDDPGSLAKVAVECGYFDHSHLVRDFRDFAGAPPAELLAALPEFTGFFTA